MHFHKKFLIPSLKLKKYENNLHIPNSLKPVVDYSFKDGKAKNVDGSYNAETIKCQYLDEYDGEKNVLFLNDNGSCIKIPSIGKLEYSAAFGVEINFYPKKKNQSGQKRINIIEGQSIPFAIMLEDVADKDYFLVSASIHLKNGWNVISSDFWQHDKYGVSSFVIPKDKWTKIALVFTGVDLFLFVDDKKIRRRMCNNNSLVSVGDSHYYIGTFVDGSQYQFYGYVSNVKIWDKVPLLYYSDKIDEMIEKGLDEIVNKYNLLNRDKGVLGKAKSYYDEPIEINGIKGLKRNYEHGVIYWSPKTGAKEIHGDILKEYEHYNSIWGNWPYENAINHNIFLGFPVSDETPGETQGTRFSKFQNGAIYWSGRTGACVLTSRIYEKYLSLGGDKSFLRLPTKLNNVNNDVVQFEGGNLYDGYMGVFEVHGSILKKYLTNPTKYGVPLSDEGKILNEKGEDTGRRISSFTLGSIFWTNTTGAVFVDYKILLKYLDEGGPNGKLGYPIKDDFHAPLGLSYELRMQDFENGIILYKKDDENIDIKVITQLEVYIDDAVSGEIDDGWYIPKVKRNVSPELYSHTYLKLIFFDENNNKTYKTLDGGTRRPRSGHSSDHIIMHKNYTIDSPKSNMWIQLDIKYYDDDMSPNDDDYLGIMSMMFTPETGWGMFEPTGGIYTRNLTSYSSDHLSWAGVIKTKLSVRQPSVHDSTKCFREQYWWFFDNFKRKTISYEFYANTFSDVSVDQNKIMHPINYALYKLMYEDIASNGNCFGMSTEVMYVFSNRSLFTFPLDKNEYKPYSGNYQISNESELPTTIHETLTRKQMYQLSSKSIWWSMKKIGSLESIKPLNVYEQVKKRLKSERGVIISMIDLANGRGHAVLAYGTDESDNKKKILIADPNVPFTAFPNQDHPSFITIKDDNTFSHFSGLYKGDYASNDLLYPVLPGTLLFEIPYSIVSDKPSTPGWYIALALVALTGGLIILAGDSSVSQIKSNNKKFYTIIDGKKRIQSDAIKNFMRLPMFDIKEGSKEIYAQQGEMQKEIGLEILGNKYGDYTKIIKTSYASIMFETNTNKNEKDEFNIDDLDTIEPFVRIKTTCTKKRVKITYAFVNNIFGLRDRRITVNLPISKDIESVFCMDTDTGGVILRAGISNEIFNVTIDVLEQNKIISYSLDIVSNEAGETIKIIPQVINHNKNAIIERGFVKNGVDEITKEIVQLS